MRIASPTDFWVPFLNGPRTATLANISFHILEIRCHTYSLAKKRGEDHLQPEEAFLFLII